MFREKCTGCGKKVSKSYEFCPHCGKNIIGLSSKSNFDSEKNYGLLGQDDGEEEFKLPFGLNMMLKPLMKELGKQMSLLDKELRREQGAGNKVNSASPRFSIHVGMPGRKLIRVNSFGPGMNMGQVAQQARPPEVKLPKFSPDALRKIGKLKKKEPETNVRRLADRIIYEIELPGVESLASVNLSNLETGLEIKAFSNKNIFVKNFEMKLPLMNYFFDSGKLILEFEVK